MDNNNTIPDASYEDHEHYKWQAENKILPKVGFKNAKEVRHALENNNCYIVK